MENTLHKAYVHIDGGDLQTAIDFLELLISVNPVNVEAWEAYMQICTTCEELDFLCERVLQVAGINRIDRESILDYYYFLRQKVASRDLDVELQESVTLELVDQFNLTLKDQRGDRIKYKYGFVWLLSKTIVIPYVVLLMIGLNLLSIGNNFGYWILVVLALSTFVSPWMKKNSFDESNRKSSVYHSTYSEMRSDEIKCYPELIH